MPKQPITNIWQVNGLQAAPQPLLNSKTDPQKLLCTTSWTLCRNSTAKRIKCKRDKHVLIL
ncbi:hypothetical protein Hanom_Chr07g00651501 [Helianthus anomalus]